MGPKAGPGTGAGIGPGAGAKPGFDLTKKAPPSLFHIPCPNGHELETPPEMLEQEVLCPQCGAQFKLRERDSVEYKTRKAAEQDRRAEKLGRAWLNWSITIAIVVVLGLIVLIAISSSG